MSTFKDDIGFWGHRGSRRKSQRKSRRKLHSDSVAPSKKEVLAFERGIIVGMKTSFKKNRHLRRLSASTETAKQFRRLSASTETAKQFRRLSATRPTCAPSEFSVFMSPQRRFSAMRFGRHRRPPMDITVREVDIRGFKRRVGTRPYDAKRRVDRRSYDLRSTRPLRRMPHTPYSSPTGSPRWTLGRKHSVAADAMRMYQNKHRSNPNYTLKQAWKDVRKRGNRFGFGAEAASDRFAIGAERSSDQFGADARSEFGADARSEFGAEARSEFGAEAASDRFAIGAERSSDRFAIGAERSSDLSFGEDEHSFGGASHKVAFGRPSFGRPQLTL